MRRIISAASLCLAAVFAVGVGGAFAARSTTPLTTEGVLQQETSLGDLVADAIEEAGSTQAALVNATQFKPGTIPAGKVTAGARLSSRLNAASACLGGLPVSVARRV